MYRAGRYTFKRADTAAELEQIHALNYRTFVHEIPQHADPGGSRLVDKFHDKNAYFVALRDERVVGMVCLHDRPPFSIAARLRDPGVLTAEGRRPVEVRLLSVEPGERHGLVFAGLVWAVYLHLASGPCTHLFISGVETRIGLYRQLGFEALGPAVQDGGSCFVPMVMCLADAVRRKARYAKLWQSRLRRLAEHGEAHATEADQEATGPVEPVCLLPGPVTPAPEVEAALRQPPLYHRSAEFLELFQRVRDRLGAMVGGKDVALFVGSGTLANEVIGATLAAKRMPGKGLVLINGEFGRRLAEQARRFGLQPRTLTWPWGRPWDLGAVAAALAEEPAGSWVWAVHQETSTGVLNDLPALVQIAKARGVQLCVDCVSSLGTAELDLREVFLASGTSGKALGAPAGIAMVFADAAALADPDWSGVPGYLDLAATLAEDGPRYTFPSGPLRALAAALDKYHPGERARQCYARQAELGAWLREELRRAGIEPLAAEPHAGPSVVTFAPPDGFTAEQFVARCRDWGFLVGGQSRYLAERNLAQIAAMGAVTRAACAPLFAKLGKLTSCRSSSSCALLPVSLVVP